MFVSKNRTLLLVALAAMLSSADSFTAENQGWGNWFYNQLPSRSSLGYYGGSALSGVSPYVLGRYTPIIERPSYALTKMAAMGAAAPTSQSLLDAYYQPTLAQQRRAQFLRALTGASAAGVLSQYAPSLDWKDKLLVMGMGAALAGGIPSFYSSAEQIAEENALRRRRNQEINQALEREAQEGYQAPSNTDFLGGLTEKHQYSGPFLSAEGQHKFNKLASIFGYEDLAAEVIEKAKARAAREKLESHFLESLLNVE